MSAQHFSQDGGRGSGVLAAGSMCSGDFVCMALMSSESKGEASNSEVRDTFRPVIVMLLREGTVGMRPPLAKMVEGYA